MAKSMATKAVKKSATLEIDGARYFLVYDFNAIAEAESLCGVNLLHGISALFLNTMTAMQLRAILYASLQPLQPHKPATKDKPESGVSMAQAGQMIRINTMPAIMTAISEAWALSMPEATENPPGATVPPAGD